MDFILNPVRRSEIPEKRRIKQRQSRYRTLLAKTLELGPGMGNEVAGVPKKRLGQTATGLRWAIRRDKLQGNLEVQQRAGRLFVVCK